MLPIDPTTAATSSAPTTDEAFGSLGTDAFLQLLVAQLQYQDPMSPNDGTQFLEQTAQYTTIETLRELVGIQQQLIGLQNVGVAIGVVDKEITAIDDLGATFSGVVDGVSFSEAGPMLDVDGVLVPLDRVVSVDGDTGSTG